MSQQQPPYNQQDLAQGSEGEDATAALMGVGTYFGLFALVIPARVVYDRTAASVGTSHLYRGFLATLRGGFSDLVGGYRQLWREDGLRMFAKWPALGFAIGVGAFAIQEGAQQACHRLLGVTQEDMEARSHKWHLSKAMCLISTGVLLYPATILWTVHSTNRMPSWTVYLRDKVWKGKDYFYSAAPLSSLSFLVFFLSDIIRAKVLHWNKKTFFPELLASPPQTEDEVYDEEPTQQAALVGGAYRPLLHQITNLSLYTLSSMLSAMLTGPIDAVTARMIANPLLYGPLGILGTVKTIYREEGVWAFFKGFVPNVVFLLGTYYAGISEEADTGKPPL